MKKIFLIGVFSICSTAVFAGGLSYAPGGGHDLHLLVYDRYDSMNEIKKSDITIDDIKKSLQQGPGDFRNTISAQQKQLDQQKKEIDDLKKSMNQLMSQVEELKRKVK